MFPFGISGSTQGGTRMMAQGRERMPGASKGRILIIDDEIEIRESLETLLDLEGYEVDLAQNGLEGERRLEQRAYDLVLLDLMRPEKSGMAGRRAVGAPDALPPVFTITAFA